MTRSKPIEFPVGLLYLTDQLGSELTDRLNEMEPFEDSKGQLLKIVAEHVLITEMDVDYKTRYKVLIDRCSHLLPQAIGAFMIFAHQGVHVINNPLSFQYFISTKDVGYAICKALGVRIPETIVLPPKENPALKEPELYQHHRPFEWEEIIERVGFPAFLKPAEGRGARKCWKVNTPDELIYHYNESGTDVMTLQAAVPSNHEWQVRCLCLGRTIIPIKFTFRYLDGSTYEYEEDFLSPETGKMVLDQAKVINRAFGYEMNSVEFMIDKEGIPWAIDFNNPVPDGRIKALGSVYFNDYIEGLKKLVTEIAFDPPEYPFLPAEVNRMAEIARKTIPPEKRFELALAEANKYYKW